MTIINALSSYTIQVVKFKTVLWLFILSAFRNNEYLFTIFITLLFLIILMSRDTVRVLFRWWLYGLNAARFHSYLVLYPAIVFRFTCVIWRFNGDRICWHIRGINSYNLGAFLILSRSISALNFFCNNLAAMPNIINNLLYFQWSIERYRIIAFT